jgi:membrane protease subunit HflC
MNRISGILATLLVLVSIGYNSLTYRVGEWETAVVLQFGKPVATVYDLGLHFKTPFVQNVLKFDKRLLEYDASPKVLLTRDKQQLMIDNFARWRIVDPLVFYKSVLTEGGAQSRLDDIIYSAVREAVARKTLTQVVSGDRNELLAYVTDQSRERAASYGIEVVDVRIKRADLPEKNEQNVFRRMRTERERQAKKFRAEGEEEARKIRSQAERERQVLLAEATRESQLIRGKGEAKATAIFAEAYGADPEFFEFQRTLEAYRTTLDEQTTFVLSPDSEFLRLLTRSR